MKACQCLKFVGWILAAAVMGGCGPVYFAPGNGEKSKIDESARHSEQIPSFQFRLPTQDPFGATQFPLALTWNSPSTLNADYDVQICKTDGSNCRVEFRVLCADRYVCGVRLSDGTLISNFRLSRTASPQRPNHTDFSLTMCDLIPGSLPSDITLRIQPIVAGNAETVVQGTAQSDISAAYCSAY